MDDEPVIDKLGWGIIISVLLSVLIIIGFSLPLLDGDSATSTPNLYELTRQTAENTRHIFWLIVVCFAAWSFRSYKTGK